MPSAEFDNATILYDSGRSHLAVRLVCVCLGTAFLIHSFDLLVFLLSGRSLLSELVDGHYTESTVGRIGGLIAMSLMGAMLVSAWSGRRVILLDETGLECRDRWLGGRWSTGRLRRADIARVTLRRGGGISRTRNIQIVTNAGKCVWLSSQSLKDRAETFAAKTAAALDKPLARE